MPDLKITMSHETQESTGVVWREERVPVFEDGKFKIDSRGQQVYKTKKVKVHRHKTLETFMWECGGETGWATQSGLAKAFGKKKALKAIKEYKKESLEEKHD